MTRIYIDKGDAPLFFDLSLEGAKVHDRVPADRREHLHALVKAKGPVVVPTGNREGIAELVDLARDEEQSLYRVLWLDDGRHPQACVGFGRVAATDDTYDCFGLVASDAAWAARGLRALAEWLRKAGARVLRFEVDEGNAEVVAAAQAAGFVEEGRIDDFYAKGAHHRMLIWRPATK